MGTMPTVTKGKRLAFFTRRPPLAGLRLSDRRLLLILGDTLAGAGAALLALWAWTLTSGALFTWGFALTHAGWLCVLVPAWILVNIDLYSPRNANSWASMTNSLLTNASLAVLAYVILFFVAPREALPRLLILYFIGGAALLSLTWRRLYVSLFASTYFQRRALVVGAGWAGEVIVTTLAQSQPQAYRILGFIDDDPSKHDRMIGGVPVLGGRQALLPTLRAQRVSEVILAVMGELQGATFQTLLECQALGVPVVLMSALYEQITGRVPLEHLNADLMAASFTNRAAPRSWFDLSKRFIDLLGGSVGLLLTLCLFPVVAIAIRLASPGPIFYRQLRLGRNGHPFVLYKFRTMVADAEADGRARWADPEDERVTGLGRWLRRFRLDEMPQFWNVLLGEMSLVGPRPERPEFIAELEREIPFYGARHLVKPGITGWAQVNYGYSATVADAAVKLQWDLYYIKHRSWWLDLVILLRTIAVVLAGQGT